MNLTYLEIDHQRSHFDRLSDATRDAFMERFVLSWLYHDHALEGVVLTEGDIWRALSKQPVRNYCDGVVQKSLLRQREIALSFFDPATRPPELTLDFIKQLHVKLCDPGDTHAGRYRKRDTSPGVYNLAVVPHASISYYFHRFMETYDKELRHMHPVRAAAIAHWEYMKVFPFDHRSGVVGRLMMNYLLVRAGYPPAIIHAHDRHHYFGALDGTRMDLIPVVVDAISGAISAAQAFSQQAVA